MRVQHHTLISTNGRPAHPEAHHPLTTQTPLPYPTLRLSAEWAKHLSAGQLVTDVAIDWASLTPEGFRAFRQSLGNRDQLMAECVIDQMRTLEKARGAPQKCLVVMNYRHAFDLTGRSPRAQKDNTFEYLKEAFGARAANVLLNWSILHAAPNAGGLWDAAFARTGNRPAGFDFAQGPFGEDPFDLFPFLPSVKAKLQYRDVFTGFVYTHPLTDQFLEEGIPGYYEGFETELLRRAEFFGAAFRRGVQRIITIGNGKSVPAKTKVPTWKIETVVVLVLTALRQALTNKNVWARRNAAGVLGLSVSQADSVVPTLIASLKDADVITRSAAVHSLTRFPQKAEVILPALMEGLNDPDATFRANVARALAHFGQKAKPAISMLLRAVESEDAHESITAVQTLAEIDPVGTLHALMANLESPTTNVRNTSARALMVFKSDGRPAVPALIKCLKDEDNAVRQNAAVALREIGQEPDLAVPALMENLKDPDLRVRTITGIALGAFGARAKAAVPAILKLIEENKDDQLSQGGLCLALEKIDPDALAKAGEK